MRITGATRPLVPAAPLPEKAFARGTAASAEVVLSHGRAEIQLRVDANKLAEAFPGAKGQARVFMMFPESTPGGLTWRKEFLTEKAPGSAEFSASVSTSSDNAQGVLRGGVAFGAETPRGIVWFQGQGENYPARTL